MINLKCTVYEIYIL